MTMTYIDNRAPVGRRVSIDELEDQRASLVRHCQRILGSAADAEDAVQETLMRAWRKLDGFECRTSVKAWLRRIATNVCLDMVRGPNRRTVAVDLGPSSAVAGGLADMRSPDPGTSAESKEAVERAFVTALQHLPARQRAVLILHDVLRWRAREIAELLDTTEAAVNSALQRGRATMAACHRKASHSEALKPAQRALVARYVEAFERLDVASLVSLSQTDATASR